MEVSFICQGGLKPKLTKRNYKKWSTLIIDHLRREHKEVFPYLCSNELISSTKEQPPVKGLLDIIIFSINSDCFHVIRKLIKPYDISMALWKEYGDPIVPPFLDDILSFVASVMVPSNSRRDPTS